MLFVPGLIDFSEYNLYDREKNKPALYFLLLRSQKDFT